MDILKKKNYLWLRITNLIFFILMALANGLSGAGSLGKYSQSEVSNLNPTKITPAGWAFSIWGLIYFLLAVFSIYQIRDWNIENSIYFSKQSNVILFEGISFYFSLSCLINILWCVVFSVNSKATMIISLIIIICLLVVLMKMYLFLQKTRKGLNLIEQLSLLIGISIYTAWVTGATILNVALMFVRFEVQDNLGFSQTTWTIIILVIALGIYLACSITNKDPFFALVFVWFNGALSDKTNENSIRIVNYINLAICAVVAIVMFVMYYWKDLFLKEIKVERLERGFDPLITNNP